MTVDMGIATQSCSCTAVLIHTDLTMKQVLTNNSRKQKSDVFIWQPLQRDGLGLTSEHAAQPACMQ